MTPGAGSIAPASTARTAAKSRARRSDGSMFAIAASPESPESRKRT
jgi:hypothetical protein